MPKKNQKGELKLTDLFFEKEKNQKKVLLEKEPKDFTNVPHL